mmetsp:Transcript_3434/g.5028  ORF Transcript_3434/g.5028 Transcript_3434/m.5028 type:complete len:118 (+) Transcript_3434:584-937(+)
MHNPGHPPLENKCDRAGILRVRAPVVAVVHEATSIGKARHLHIIILVMVITITITTITIVVVVLGATVVRRLLRHLAAAFAAVIDRRAEDSEAIDQSQDEEEMEKNTSRSDSVDSRH